MTTNRRGSVDFTNDWGEDIASITIRHRRGNDSSKQEDVTLYNVSSGERLDNVLQFTYETGAASPYDYWWIKFITNSTREFTIKNNFYCSVAKSDNGKVFLRIDGSDKKMYVNFSNSSGCFVKIF